MTRRIALPIDADHPALAGHFPGRPIVPGVVLLDHSLRALAAEITADGGAGPHWRIGTAKFLSFVRPGEPVHLELDDPTPAGAHRLRVLAGDGSDARVAMTGSVSPIPSVA